MIPPGPHPSIAYQQIGKPFPPPPTHSTVVFVEFISVDRLSHLVIPLRDNFDVDPLFFFFPSENFPRRSSSELAKTAQQQCETIFVITLSLLAQTKCDRRKGGRLRRLRRHASPGAWRASTPICTSTTTSKPEGRYLLIIIFWWFPMAVGRVHDFRIRIYAAPYKSNESSCTKAPRKFY